MPLDVEKIRRLAPHRTLHYFKTLGSTMVEAASLVGNGAPHGTVVIAEEQTSGMGRLGRGWVSQPEVGIYCSILLRLAVPSTTFPVASLVLGLATAEAIQKSTQLICDLRWPNDVLIDEKKVAGILTHLVDGVIVAGIGVNVNNTSFGPGLRTPATSLKIAAGGRSVSREDLLIHLLDSVDSFCALFESEGPGSILRAFTNASSYVLNRRVVIEETGSTGLTAGLDDSGFLLVLSDTGTTERFAAGGVRASF